MEQQKMGMSKRQFRIGDLAKELKVKKFVIRFWEKEFNLKSDRSHGGQRFYTKEDFDTFMFIKDLLYSQGFTILGAKKQLDALLKGDVIPAQKYLPEDITSEKQAQSTEDFEEEDELENTDIEFMNSSAKQEEIMPASSEDLTPSTGFTAGACCLHAQTETVNSNDVSVESIEQTIKQAIEDAKVQARAELKAELEKEVAKKLQEQVEIQLAEKLSFIEQQAQEKAQEQIKEQVNTQKAHLEILVQEKLTEQIAQEREKIRSEFVSKLAPIQEKLSFLKSFLES